MGVLGLETRYRVDLHGASSHLSRPGVESPSVDEGVMEELADLAPGFRDIISDRSFEVGRVQETRPSLIAGGRLPGDGFGEGKGHVRVSQELTVGISLEGQAVRGNKQPVAELSDAQSIVRQGLKAVEKRPSGRSDLIVVALRLFHWMISAFLILNDHA